MLTIKNIHKLENRTLNKRNFYVANTDYSINQNNEHYYIIDISNYEYVKKVKLNREQIVNGQWKGLYHMTCEWKAERSEYYVDFEAIKNIDKFINAVRLVGLS